MMLSRFDTLDGSAPAYADRIPVFLVMADNDGGVTAGYHGTTVLAQMLRGLWPSLAEKCKDALRVESVAINDPESFRRYARLASSSCPLVTSAPNWLRQSNAPLTSRRLAGYRPRRATGI